MKTTYPHCPAIEHNIAVGVLVRAVDWRKDMDITAQAIDIVLAVLLVMMFVLSVGFLIYLRRTA
jgi:hypothetical protein